MATFVEVVKQGSFAKAARSMSLSTSVVSRQVSDLEQWLGAELLVRTTRTLSLTEQGERCIERCEQVLAEVGNIKAIVSAAQAEPSGTLRLTASAFFAKECLHHMLPAYLRRYPEVRIQLTAVDRRVDLVDEAFDLALRIGRLADSSLIARKLTEVELVVLASPAYLAEHGEPRTPAELREHNCIVDTVAGFGSRWPMKGSPRQQVSVSGNISVNGGELARNLALAGVGLALLPRFFAVEQLQRGELVTVLDGMVDFNAGLFAVYPKKRHPTAKVRSFIDALIEFVDAHERSFGSPPA